MKKVKEQRIIEDKAIDAVNKYLRSKGWNPLVGGFDSIEQDRLKYNFRLIFKFTGKKLKKKE